MRTAPAEIRLLREADNPWYEVTLIEGKNRQIRRMFEEIGHHVEKIRRVRYGPLSLDVEPGQFRELTSLEVESLRRLDKPSRVEQRARGATRHQKSSLPKPRRATAPRERGRSGIVRGEDAHQRFERGELDLDPARLLLLPGGAPCKVARDGACSAGQARLPGMTTHAGMFQ